jgi:hypothetical protein
MFLPTGCAMLMAHTQWIEVHRCISFRQTWGMPILRRPGDISMRDLGMGQGDIWGNYSIAANHDEYLLKLQVLHRSTVETHIFALLCQFGLSPVTIAWRNWSKHFLGGQNSNRMEKMLRRLA